jgi:hypothetical protein
MNDVAGNLAAVRAAIARACARYGRDPATVGLVAVSKKQPVAAVQAALAAGQRDFGENYPQEGAAKAAALVPAEAARATWHFIGQLQANKTRLVAEAFDWVHGVDRARIAERLAAQRPASRGPLRCCIQVNLSGETGKGGVTPDEVPALARAVAALPNLRLEGLMTLPAPERDFERQRAPFRALRELRDRLRADGMALDVLSMGMSDDFEAAIAEGATLLRIGTAIFGARR